MGLILDIRIAYFIYFYFVTNLQKKNMITAYAYS